MSRWAWIGGVLLAIVLLGGCLSTDSGTGNGGDCESHYVPVASAPTWDALEDAMLATEDWGAVASVRTQARGEDIGLGDQDVVRIVDLLNRNGRRLAQAEVWRTGDGGWAAGVWSQCID
ncbi:hypothetical protein [Nocardioides sp. T2.26MG-1]|uniref:hypothetical protein n=1 Tax=Nocardioides sp. T2.26MG-1 TaxID=3041166 RepID=UPI002477B822|nr:hypothetical protein [Nocardioides sp. T2.26MG-1]CAI9413762.1 hypothetical protein HIDPHFAB_02103 [Nocardioides sp. T2.26MG-1]